jgi:hypothetical protein
MFEFDVASITDAVFVPKFHTTNFPFQYAIFVGHVCVGTVVIIVFVIGSIIVSVSHHWFDTAIFQFQNAIQVGVLGTDIVQVTKFVTQSIMDTLFQV